MLIHQPPLYCKYMLLKIRYVNKHSTVHNLYIVHNDVTQSVSMEPTYVEMDESFAPCCRFLRTGFTVYIYSIAADARINKHSLTNGKTRIQWQVSKIKSSGNSFSCISSRLSWWDIFPPPAEYLPFVFPYFPLEQFVHTSMAKKLSSLGLIPIPKCFTASVITSS